MGNDTGAQRKVPDLEEIVNKEKRHIAELEHKYTLTLHQLDLATTREEQLRNEGCELERNLALIKHELKEVISHKNSVFSSPWYHLCMFRHSDALKMTRKIGKSWNRTSLSLSENWMKNRIAGHVIIAIHKRLRNVLAHSKNRWDPLSCLIHLRVPK